MCKKWRVRGRAMQPRRTEATEVRSRGGASVTELGHRVCRGGGRPARLEGAQSKSRRESGKNGPREPRLVGGGGVSLLGWGTMDGAEGRSAALGALKGLLQHRSLHLKLAAPCIAVPLLDWARAAAWVGQPVPCGHVTVGRAEQLSQQSCHMQRPTSPCLEHLPCKCKLLLLPAAQTA